MSKTRTRRTIPAEAAMSLAFIRNLPRRSQGPKRHPHAKLRSALQHYINRHPGLTSDTKRVGCLLVLWYRPTRTLHPALATIAGELSINRDTVSVAVATLHSLELVFSTTGGFGAMANEYVPNYWLVLNQGTGAVMKEAEYDFSAGKWRTSAKSVTEIPAQKPVTEIPSQDTPQERRNSAKSVTEIPSPCSYSVRGSPPADAPSPNGSGPPSSSPEQNKVEPKSKKPKNSGKMERQEFFAELGALALALGTTPKDFLAAGNGDAGRELDRLCREYAFPGGRVFASPLSHDPPRNGGLMVCVEVIAGEGNYQETQTGLNIGHDFMSDDSPVYVAFHIPKAVRDQSEKDFEAMMEARTY